MTNAAALDQRELHIGLANVENRDAIHVQKSAPSGQARAQRWFAQQRADDLERQFEPISLFGIDRELQIAVARQMRKTRDLEFGAGRDEPEVVVGPGGRWTDRRAVALLNGRR